MSKKIQGWLEWAIKVATVIVTAPATNTLLLQAGIPTIPRFAGVALVEGVWMAYWIRMERTAATERMGKLYDMVGTVLMYGIVLLVGTLVDGIAGWPPRIAAGIAIAYHAVPFFTKWYRQARQDKVRAKGLVKFEERILTRRSRRAIKQAYHNEYPKLVVLHQERVRSNLVGEAKQNATSSGTRPTGKSTCIVVTEERNGKHYHRAVCQLPDCGFVSEWFTKKRQASGSGNGHSRTHNEVDLAIPEVITIEADDGRPE
jgi:hypothetical protein